jgi:hypothetical protein
MTKALFGPIYWLVALVIAVLAITRKVVEFTQNAFLDLLLFAGVMAPKGNPQTNQDVLDFFATANAFIPLGEASTLITAYTVVLLSGFLYRLIKSWLPVIGT